MDSTPQVFRKARGLSKVSYLSTTRTCSKTARHGVETLYNGMVDDVGFINNRKDRKTDVFQARKSVVKKQEFGPADMRQFSNPKRQRQEGRLLLVKVKTGSPQSLHLSMQQRNTSASGLIPGWLVACHREKAIIKGSTSLKSLRSLATAPRGVRLRQQCGGYIRQSWCRSCSMVSAAVGILRRRKGSHGISAANSPQDALSEQLVRIAAVNSSGWLMNGLCDASTVSGPHPDDPLAVPSTIIFCTVRGIAASWRQYK
ncbi:uncharacterized protein N7498_009096 [Penicillium cinerascens]|uniref:Uncharacterized protein n=1 Tax=Penicillium cinerascens TaxID=70096 RepID=A0A9W9J9E6_9EURO|nr:uncharacterized protein N7498_009096 [Penicillium cinerascens]KAJ5190111.1 hypothetical protein N7498_009096 [Penicillium cinerascens]